MSELKFQITEDGLHEYILPTLTDYVPSEGFTLVSERPAEGLVDVWALEYAPTYNGPSVCLAYDAYPDGEATWCHGFHRAYLVGYVILADCEGVEQEETPVVWLLPFELEMGVPAEQSVDQFTYSPPLVSILELEQAFRLAEKLDREDRITEYASDPHEFRSSMLHSIGEAVKVQDEYEVFSEIDPDAMNFNFELDYTDEEAVEEEFDYHLPDYDPSEEYHLEFGFEVLSQPDHFEYFEAQRDTFAEMWTEIWADA